MPMDPADRDRAVRLMAKWLFERPNETATVKRGGLEEAADNIYDQLVALGPQIAGGMPTTFRTKTSPAQKKRAVAIVAAIDGGVFDA